MWDMTTIRALPTLLHYERLLIFYCFSVRRAIPICNIILCITTDSFHCYRVCNPLPVDLLFLYIAIVYNLIFCT